MSLSTASLDYLTWETKPFGKNRRRLCDVRVMSSEKLCLMQHADRGDIRLTIEPLLRKRLESNLLSLKGLDTGLLPDIADSYVRSVGTPFSRIAFRVIWAADVLLCTDASCNAVIDIRWLDQKEEELALILHMLPGGRLGFGLNYDAVPAFNPENFLTRPMRKVPNPASMMQVTRRRSRSGGRRRVIYKDMKKYRRSNETQFDLYSLRNTAMLERVQRSSAPLVGRVQLPRGCHLLVYPNSAWYRKFVRMGKEDRCQNVSHISLMYSPTKGMAAVHCDVRSQKSMNARVSCYNSSWITTISSLSDDDPGLLIPVSFPLSGIEFNVFTTLRTDGNEIEQNLEWSMFSRALRGIVAEGRSRLPSTCLDIKRSFFPGNVGLDHNVTSPTNCKALEAQVDLESTMKVEEKGKTLQDFITPEFVELSPNSSGALGFAGFERLTRSSANIALNEIQQDALRRVREIEDQFSTRLSETYTTLGAAMAFLIALFGILLSWPSLRDTVNQYWQNIKLRIPLGFLYLFFTTTVVLGLILPIIIDEAVAKQNSLDGELQTLQNSARLGGYGDYHMVMITSLSLEPLRQWKVWIFYSFILALCALVIALGLFEARTSLIRRKELASLGMKDSMTPEQLENNTDLEEGSDSTQ